MKKGDIDRLCTLIIPLIGLGGAAWVPLFPRSSRHFVVHGSHYSPLIPIPAARLACGP
jgi:hypothetical protein